MKKIFLFVLLLAMTMTLVAKPSIKSRLRRYSGENYKSLYQYFKSLDGDKKDYCEFILKYSSDEDLAVLTKEYLDEQLTYVLKAKALPYTKDVPDDYFYHFVLPLRISQEPFENWRPKFFNDLYPIIKDAKTLQEALFLSDRYYSECSYFKQTSGRDQAPLTTIKRGYGRCEELMIIQMCIYRAIGIPCRPASAPYWSFSDSNHVWTEVWTSDGWTIGPEGYPAKYKKSSWEIDSALRAPLVTSEVFGSSKLPNTLRKNDFYSNVNITEDYTETANISINVVDEKNKPVEDANVVFYATTFGGLFQLHSAKTDENGNINIDFGKSSFWVTAGKNKLAGSAFLSSLEDKNSATITIKKDYIYDENMVYHFPLKGSAQHHFDTNPDDQKYADDMFTLYNKKRDVRLLSQKKTREFLTNFPLKSAYESADEYIKKREDYLAKCDELAGNADNWLVVDKAIKRKMNKDILRKIMVDMIIDWNIKDLIELPDTTAIMNTLDIFAQNRDDFDHLYDYDTFRKGIINPVFGSNPFPENGWRKPLYDLISKLKSHNPDTTVKNIQKWMNDYIKDDKDAEWSYFSGSLNPMQSINKKYLKSYQRTYLLTAMLQSAGVPLRWQGFLEYNNGEEWTEIPLDLEKEETVERVEKSFQLVITVDNNEVKAEPWSNFILARGYEDGNISNTWFDIDNQDGKTLIKYFNEKDSDNYIQGLVRNSNGDAHVLVKHLNGDEDVVTLNFTTPKSIFENQITWSDNTLNNISKLIEDNVSLNNKTILFVRHKNGNEPQERMVKLLIEKANEAFKKDANIVIYSQERDNSDIKNVPDNKKFILLNGDTIIEENLKLENFPLIFIIENGKVVNSANGFDLGLINYMIRDM